MKVTAPILHPLFLQVTRHDGDLVRDGAYGSFEIHPVRIRGDVGVLSRGHIFELGQSWRLIESVAPAGTVIDELNILEVSDERQIASAYEGSVAHDIAVWIGVHKTRIRIGERKIENEFPVRRKRRRQSVDIKAQGRVFDYSRLPALKTERSDINVRPRDDVNIFRP